MRAQAAQIAAGLQKSGLQVSGDREIVAMIAYLQRLGTDIKSQGAR
jgi:cytochrome c oxidase cbb3-type subunit I/II